MEHFLVHWLKPITPIYRREAARARSSQAPRRLLRGFGLLIIVIALGIILLMFVMVSIANASPFMSVVLEGATYTIPFVIPLLIPVLRVRVAVSASYAVASEVESRTWETLRALPWSAAQIVTSKYAGALLRAHRQFYVLLVLRILLALEITFGILLLMQAPFLAYQYLGANLRLLWLAGLPYYFLAFLLDFATDGALGMVASVFSPSQSQAMQLGSIVGAIGVGGQLLLDMTPVIVLSNSGDVASFLVLLLLLFVARAALLRGLLRLAASRAERIEHAGA